MHIIGGHDSNKYITFDPNNEKFTEIHSFPDLSTGIPGSGLIHVRSKNILLLFGGYDADHEPSHLDIIKHYSIMDNKWHDLSLRLPSRDSDYPIFISPNEKYIVMNLSHDNEEKWFYLDLEIDDLNCMEFKEIDHIETPVGYTYHALMAGDRMRSNLTVYGFIREMMIDIPDDMFREIVRWYDEKYVHFFQQKDNDFDSYRHYIININDLIPNYNKQ